MVASAAFSDSPGSQGAVCGTEQTHFEARAHLSRAGFSKTLLMSCCWACLSQADQRGWDQLESTAAGSSCTGEEGLQMLHFNSLSKTSLAIKKILCLEQIEVGEEEHRQ